MLDQILVPEWVDIPSRPGVPPGPAGAKRTLAMLTTTFPDLPIVIEDVIQDGDKVVVRSTISGIQRAEFVGIRAQGRRLSIQAVDIHEFKERSSSLQAGRAGAVPVGHFEWHPLALMRIQPCGAREFGRRWLIRSCVNVFGL